MMPLSINKVAILVLGLVCFVFDTSAQEGIGIGTEDVNSDAILEIDSQTDGLLIPRMTVAQRNAIGATSEGLIVYVDDDAANIHAFYYYDGASWLRLVAQPAQVNLNMNNHKIVNVTNGTASKDAVNKGQLDTKLNLSGGGMSGNIDMNSRKVVDMANGTASKDAVNKGQLDTKLNLSGGTMSGSIAMGNNKISGMAAGTSSTDAVNKGQLDGIMQHKAIAIGAWNMTSAHSKTVYTGVTRSKVVGFDVMIVSDAGNVYPIDHFYTDTGTINVDIAAGTSRGFNYGSGNLAVRMDILYNGFFTIGGDFNGSASRGWVVVHYTN